MAALTQSQRVAVEHRHGPLLVLAGAGTGKTATLCARIVRMVHDGVPARSILAITFTNKAAREMKERATRLLGGHGADVQIGTFHGTCARMLRTHPSFRDFTILDTADSLRVVGQALKTVGARCAKPDAVFAAMNLWRNDGLDPEQVPPTEPADMRRTYAEYRRVCMQNNSVDFADLIVHVVRLLKSDPAFRAGFRDRWRYLLVDEYQDTNPVQLELIRQLASDTNDVMVVGDDFQAIHEWRGARVRNILEFEGQFPGTTVVKLQENFRSMQTIVDAANNVIRKNEQRSDKTLVCTKGAGRPVEVHVYENAYEEANGVANIIQRGVAAGEFAYADVAVLYRLNALSQNVEKAFRRKGVPCRIVGTQSFFERAEVKDALAYVRLYANRASDVDFLRIVNVPSRHVGAAAIQRITSRAQEDGTSLFHAACTHHAEVKGRGGAGLAAFLQPFMHAVPGETPPETAARLLASSGFMQHLDSEEEDRVENVKELLNIFRRHYEEGPPGRTLPEFMASLMLEEASAPQGEDAASGVTLMSMHASKGLEFPCVFGIGLGEGTMPFVKAVDEGRLEEERRLMYVTITRAKERLWLTFPVVRHTFYGNRRQAPCRFIDEIRPAPMAVASHVRQESLQQHLASEAPGFMAGAAQHRRR